MPTLYRITLPVSDLAQGVGFYRSLLGESGMALGPGWHTWDRHKYLGAFAEIFGYTPAQIEELSTPDFDALMNYLHESGKLGDG